MAGYELGSRLEYNWGKKRGWCPGIVRTAPHKNWRTVEFQDGETAVLDTRHCSEYVRSLSSKPFFQARHSLKSSEAADEHDKGPEALSKRARVSDGKEEALAATASEPKATPSRLVLIDSSNLEETMMVEETMVSELIFRLH